MLKHQACVSFFLCSQDPFSSFFFCALARQSSLCLLLVPGQCQFVEMQWTSPIHLQRISQLIGIRNHPSSLDLAQTQGEDSNKLPATSPKFDSSRGHRRKAFCGKVCVSSADP